MMATEEPRWVRLVFVDVFGGAHAVVLPGGRFSIAVEKGAPFDGSALEGRARHLEADMLLKPDPSTLLSVGGGQARAACTGRAAVPSVIPYFTRTFASTGWAATICSATVRASPGSMPRS